MNFNDFLSNVSFSTLCDVLAELKTALFHQEKKYLREFNEYYSLKCQIKKYENEIEKRKKVAEEYV